MGVDKRGVEVEVEVTAATGVDGFVVMLLLLVCLLFADGVTGSTAFADAVRFSLDFPPAPAPAPVALEGFDDGGVAAFGVGVGMGAADACCGDGTSEDFVGALDVLVAKLSS